MSHRFFVSPESISQNQVTFDAALSHQLCNVLRMRPGALVIVLDNSGQEYQVELTKVQRDGVTGHVRAQRIAQTEPRLSITLYQCMLKGERFEWVLQKGTELGVSAFVPVFSRRTIGRDTRRIEKKRQRWERIIREAAEQSHRGRLPILNSPLSFAEACPQSAQVHTLSLIPWEEAAENSLAHVMHALGSRPASVGLFIGPEGGFDPAEIALAQRAGIQAVTLGPRILRAETAALVATAIIMSETGEM